MKFSSSNSNYNGKNISKMLLKKGVLSYLSESVSLSESSAEPELDPAPALRLRLVLSFTSGEWLPDLRETRSNGR